MNELLIAGQAYPGAEVVLSEQHQLLQECAISAANLCAEHNQGGHLEWTRRFQELLAAMPGYMPAEIAAQSWPGQDQQQSALDAYKCWEQSPGHWAVASKAHAYVGFGMAQGSAGLWYSIITVADQGTRRFMPPLVLFGANQASDNILADACRNWHLAAYLVHGKTKPVYPQAETREKLRLRLIQEERQKVLAAIDEYTNSLMKDKEAQQ